MRVPDGRARECGSPPGLRAKPELRRPERGIPLTIRKGRVVLVRALPSGVCGALGAKMGNYTSPVASRRNRHKRHTKTIEERRPFICLSAPSRTGRGPGAYTLRHERGVRHRVAPTRSSPCSQVVRGGGRGRPGRKHAHHSVPTGGDSDRRSVPLVRATPGEQGSPKSEKAPP